MKRANKPEIIASENFENLRKGIALSGKVTLRDVAKAAGVAESTASRALAGSGQLSEGTRNRIVTAAKTLGYDVAARSAKALSLDGGRRGVIGVVVAALHNSFYPYLVERLHNELDDHGFDMVLIIDEITRDRAGRKLRSLVDTLDGVIVTTADIGSPMVEFLQDRAVPTVLAIRSNQRNDVHVVESDNFSAGVEAIEHLVSLGHTKIGFLMGPATTSTTMGRLSGARSVLRNAGIPFDESKVFHTEFTHEGGYSGCIQLMRSPEPPTAIFCANDVIGIGALEAAQKSSLRVPQDLSIIGVDDIPMASWAMISLTTVRQPIGEIGSVAAKLVADVVRNSGATNPQNHIFPTDLVVRATTGPVRG